jgi:hypothetical protein
MILQDKLAQRLIKITGLDIFDKTRKRDYVEARSLLMHVFREYLGLSKTGIAEYFKSRGKPMTHATVIHHLRDWEYIVKANATLARNLNDLLGSTMKSEIGRLDYIRERLNLLDEKHIEIVYNYVFSKYADILNKQEIDEKEQIELGNHPRKVNKELIAN